MDNIRTAHLFDDLLTNQCRTFFLSSKWDDTIKSKMIRVCAERCDMAKSDKMFKHKETGLWFCVDHAHFLMEDKTLPVEQRVFKHATGRL